MRTACYTWLDSGAPRFREVPGGRFVHTDIDLEHFRRSWVEALSPRFPPPASITRAAALAAAAAAHRLASLLPLVARPPDAVPATHRENPASAPTAPLRRLGSLERFLRPPTTSTTVMNVSIPDYYNLWEAMGRTPATQVHITLRPPWYSIIPVDREDPQRRPSSVSSHARLMRTRDGRPLAWLVLLW